MSNKESIKIVDKVKEIVLDMLENTMYYEHDEAWKEEYNENILESIGEIKSLNYGDVLKYKYEPGGTISKNRRK